MHGGKSTGPRTAEGRARIAAARTKHGIFSAENRRVADLIRDLKQSAKDLIERT